jgi:DNA-binding SARP family transcriptional activator
MGVSAEQVRYSVLGQVRAWLGDQELNLGWPKQRAVLTVLLLNANRLVTRGAIVDGVWGEHAPASAVNLVHTYVRGLRRVLEPGRGPHEAAALLTGARSGYVLRLDADQLDLDEFQAMLSQARAYRAAGDPGGAARAYTAALALWGGPPFAGIPGPRAGAERTRLAELHLAAVEDQADVMLELGGHGELTGELGALAAEHPLRERIRALQMTALYRCGRQAEALAVYTDTRKLLAEELGIDPGPELQRLHQRVLAGDPMLAKHARPGTGFPVPRQLPSGPPHFVGRIAELRQLTALLNTTVDAGGTVVISAINGTAGIGKTALAVHWAHQVADRFPGGQLYVNLRGFDPTGAPVQPTEALRGFLGALGVPQERLPVTLNALAALYRSLLAERPVLVVLDNARDAAHVRPLLPGSPACRVVITSRGRLASLVAQEGAHSLTLDLLSPQEATALLAGRIGAGRVAAEPVTVTGLIDSCARLPLALAIVAARAAAHPSFPLTALAGELRQASARLDALDAGEPHANLRTVLSWSADALDSQTAEVFGLLGLAPGPHISLPAAASLIAQPLTRTRALLRELENAHLLQQYTPDRYACTTWFACMRPTMPTTPWLRPPRRSHCGGWPTSTPTPATAVSGCSPHTARP